MRGTVVEMRGMQASALAMVAAICLFGTLGLGWGLAQIEGQNTPYIDATTNVLSVIATVLMVWRYKEQWLLYIILNIFTVVMWSIRTAQGSPNGPVMILMWSAFLVNAVYGYYNWNRGSRNADIEPKVEVTAA